AGRTAFKLVGEFVLGTPVSRRTRASVDREARLAEGWIASQGLIYDETRALADLYRERCVGYGRPAGVPVLRRDAYVGVSWSEAQPVLRLALSQFGVFCYLARAKDRKNGAVLTAKLARKMAIFRQFPVPKRYPEADRWRASY